VVANSSPTYRGGRLLGDLVKKVESRKFGEKTTITHVTLINGFELTETSSCVDPKNFNMELGEKICLDKIKNQIWSYLGFMLQSGLHGLDVL
jgi:hypothetical protein